MGSRAARRNRRNRSGGVAVKARQTPGSGLQPVTFTPDQVATLLNATQRGRIRGTGQQMAVPDAWSQVPFPPGRPLPIAPINQPRPDTGRPEPRQFEFTVSSNLNFGSGPLVPWRILRQAADTPLFRKCIERRKNVCTLGYSVVVDPVAVAREATLAQQPKRDVESAMREKYAPEIARIADWWREPDPVNGWNWQQWAGRLMEARLKFDATVIYPQYTYGGELLAFNTPDGSTFKPLLDENGRRPLPPHPIVQQVLYGYPRGEYTADVDPADVDDLTGRPRIPGGYAADQIMYERTVIRENTPYGMSDTEIALLDGIVWMRRMGWVLAEYTHGATGALLETSDETDWDVTQWEVWLRALNDHLGGNTADRHQWSLLPPGVKAVLNPEVAERYKPEYDLFLVKLVAGDFGLPASEVGFTETGALGAAFHEGEEDILYRITRRPDGEWLGGMATRLSVRHLGMPPVLKVEVLGQESEDEAAADAVAQAQVDNGRLTRNEYRIERGLAPYSEPEADIPMITLSRDVVPLAGAIERAASFGQPLPEFGADSGKDPSNGPAGGTGAGQAQAKPAGQETNSRDKAAAKAADNRTVLLTKSEYERLGCSEAQIAEIMAFRRWASKRASTPARPFTFTHLTAEQAVGLAAVSRNDVRGGRALFKASPPKVQAVWPGWERDLDLVAIYATRTRDATRGAVDTGQLAQDWASAHPGALKAASDPKDPFVLHWLRSVWQAIVDALRKVVGAMTTEGWVLGQQAAKAVTAAVQEVDWAGWTPGDPEAAAKVAGAGLRELLDQVGVRIKSIADSRVEELAEVLEQALASDVTSIEMNQTPLPPRLSVGDLARQLEDVLDNPGNAELVAWTEIARAQGEAARSVYAEAGYPEVDWITAEDDRVCPACAAQEASNPHPLGALPVVPMHPRCRCAEVPVLAGAS